jgi:hypothetical protein
VVRGWKKITAVEYEKYTYSVIKNVENITEIKEDNICTQGS